MGGSSGGKGGSAPKAPNYSKLMEKQNVLDKDASLYNTNMNRADQYGPGGSTTWTHDANGNFTQKTSLDPMHQYLWDQSGNLSGRSLDELSSLGQWNPQNVTPEYDPNSGRMMADALYASTMDRLRPEQDRESDRMFTKYNQMGLHPGSEAFNYASQNMQRAHGDVAAEAALKAQMAGGQEARSNYASALAGENQGYGQESQNRSRIFDEANALQNLHSGIQLPQLPGYAGASGYTPGNLTQAAQSQYEAKMGQQSANNQKKGGLANTGLQAIMQPRQ